MILITVGSQKFQFNRLLKEIDELIENKIIKEEVFAQIGVSDYKPKNYKYVDFMSQDEFSNKMDEADIEFIGDALYDIWNNMVTEAGEYGTLLELDDYYGKIEDELAEFLEPLHSESMYYLESELLTGTTKMMRLLNGGNALSMAEMQSYSPMFTDMDLVNNEWKN